MADATLKITVHIDAIDLAAFRELVERAAEHSTERETLTSALERERSAHEKTKLELQDAENDRDDANRIIGDLPTKKEMDRATALANKHKLECDMALSEIASLKIALRNALRAAAEHARDAADYAADRSEHAYAKDVREIAATYDEARAALGIDDVTDVVSKLRRS